MRWPTTHRGPLCRGKSDAIVRCLLQGGAVKGRGGARKVGAAAPGQRILWPAAAPLGRRQPLVGTAPVRPSAPQPHGRSRQPPSSWVWSWSGGCWPPLGLAASEWRCTSTRRPTRKGAAFEREWLTRERGRRRLMVSRQRQERQQAAAWLNNAGWGVAHVHLWAGACNGGCTPAVFHWLVWTSVTRILLEFPISRSSSDRLSSYCASYMASHRFFFTSAPPWSRTIAK